MNRILALFSALALAITAIAADVNPLTRHILDHSRKAMRQYEAAQGPQYIPLMLMVEGEDVVSNLEGLGVVVYHRRGDILLTSVPEEVVTEVLELEGVIDAASSGDLSATLDKARQMSWVDQTQEGLAPLASSLDGEGVVVGFSDIGFDPNHIAFKGRIAQVWDFKSRLAQVKCAVTPEEIAAWTTDDVDNFHATHVGNILAGGYHGNGYYGVATGTEIVATTSDLSDVGILCGVEKIIEYAKENGKRAVINLSLANFLGSHDGSDLFCQYLSMCGEEAVICISAGNTGHRSIYTYVDQTSTYDEAAVTVNSFRTWNGFDVAGYIDAWASGAEPFSMMVGVYDMLTGKVVFTTPWVGGEGEEDSLTVDATTYPEWGEYMTGEVKVYTQLSNLNNRYNVTVMFDTDTEEYYPDKAYSRYYNYFAFKRGNNARVDVYSDASYSYMGRPSGARNVVNSKGSISNMATGENVVVVGSCVSRNSYPVLGEGDRTGDYAVNAVSNFSSYSEVPTIKPLPLLCAPGQAVVSALSGPYYEEHPGATVCAKADVEGREYYWTVESGTSMSSPLVAGIIAQWLQANPSLTYDDITEIAETTARTDFDDFPSSQWGAGCIDAYNGAKMAVERAAGEDLTFHPVVTVNTEGGIDVTVPGVLQDKVRVYTPAGVEVAMHCRLLPGLYIVNIPGHGSMKVRVGGSR